MTYPMCQISEVLLPPLPQCVNAVSIQPAASESDILYDAKHIFFTLKVPPFKLFSLCFLLMQALLFPHLSHFRFTF